jgi:tetratricopeptide (TPR) repeat protein
VSTRICYMLAWLAVVLWARSPVIAHALSYVQQLVQLEQANQAFEQALTSPTPEAAQGYYRQAIAAYEQLIAAGIHNAKLYYNLGNAYFRLNDLGHAILHYRRGLRLEPGNRQLQANLSYARSRRLDQIDVSSERQHAFLPQLFFWSDDLSVPIWPGVGLRLRASGLASCGAALGPGGGRLLLSALGEFILAHAVPVYDQASRRDYGGGSRGAQRQRRELYATVATAAPCGHGIRRARSTRLLARH